MKSKFYTPREAIIPKGARKVWDLHSDAVAYLYETQPHGGKCAMIFYGQQSKPAGWYRYGNEIERERSIASYFSARQEHAKRRAEGAAERKAEVATVKFELGKTYYDRSACDYDTIYSYKIVARTAKTLTIQHSGKTKRRGIFVYEGVEWCKPHGTYSMCPMIRADKRSAEEHKDGTP